MHTQECILCVYIYIYIYSSPSDPRLLRVQVLLDLLVELADRVRALLQVLLGADGDPVNINNTIKHTMNNTNNNTINNGNNDKYC